MGVISKICMFKDIDYILKNHSCKKNWRDYLEFGLFLGVSSIMIVLFLILIFIGVTDFQETIILTFMILGFGWAFYLTTQQWKKNYAFEKISNELIESENHTLILDIVKMFKMEIIDNNVHRTIVIAKGKTSISSLGSTLTFVYSNNIILVNSLPTIGTFLPWPYYRTDITTIVNELKKADNIASYVKPFSASS